MEGRYSTGGGLRAMRRPIGEQEGLDVAVRRDAPVDHGTWHSRDVLTESSGISRARRDSSSWSPDCFSVCRRQFLLLLYNKDFYKLLYYIILLFECCLLCSLFYLIIIIVSKFRQPSPPDGAWSVSCVYFRCVVVFFRHFSSLSSFIIERNKKKEKNPRGCFRSFVLASLGNTFAVMRRDCAAAAVRATPTFCNLVVVAVVVVVCCVFVCGKKSNFSSSIICE